MSKWIADPRTTNLDDVETPTAVADAPPLTGNRRSLFKFGAAAVAGLLMPSVVQAQGKARTRGPTTSTGHEPQSPNSMPRPTGLDSSAAWLSPEARLVRRITMGLTDAEVTRAQTMGYAAYLEYQLADAAIDDSAVDQFVATTYPFTTQDVSTLYNADTTQVQNQIIYATIYRSIYSARQLKERAVEFWSDHFNIAIAKVGYLKLPDDRDVIRANALTTFPQLLRASAHSPAMLAYLDQTASLKASPNQNYAREIMELHTLGVNGGYTQTDVAELSRVLTGWTIAGRGTFTFAANLHDYGAKTVLGVTIPATATSTGVAAQQEGEDMLTLLINHPSTATFVSTRMLIYFLRYDPTPAQIATVAAVYTSTGGDIKSMLRAVLSQANLMAAPAKMKRPFHLVASGVRSLNPTVTAVGVANLAGQIAVAGHQPFNWQTPDGYPDMINYWAGNMLPRWNYGSFLANANTATSVQFNVAPFMTTPTAAFIVSQIDKFLFGGEAPQRLRDELTAYVSVAPTLTARVRETIALAMASSTYQYY